MRILQVMPYFDPKRGGDVNVCAHLSVNLKKLGHEVTIVSSDFGIDPMLVSWVRNQGVRLESFGSLVRTGLFIVTPSMRKWIRRNIESYDVVHIQGYRSYQSRLVNRESRRLEVPYIVQPHGSVLPFSRRILLKKFYDLVWGRKILEDALAVFALTPREKEDCMKMGVSSDKVFMVPNGIDYGEFQNSKDDGIRAKYNLRSEDIMVTYVGRLSQTKGLDLLAQSFRLVLDQKDNAKLVVVGPDDGYRKKLLEICEELGLSHRVVLTGFVDRADRAGLLSASSVFVTPSYSGLPITFLESIASGIPIITTSHGDSIEWINNNVGLVVKYDADEMAKAILQILDDDELTKRFKDNGKRLASSTFEWKAVAAKIGKIYAHLIQSRSGE